jgi:hypothetical protein
MTNTPQRGVGRAILTSAMTGLAVATLALASLVAVNSAEAQRPTPPRPAPRTQTPRRQETIEIRGQVPTPQVVTVRPRETPVYSRRVLVPAFFDRDFWPSILPALQIVLVPATLSADTTTRATPDSASRAQPATRPPSGTPPASLRP